MSIVFHTNPFFSQRIPMLKEWLQQCAFDHQATIVRLESNFVTPDRLYAINKAHLNHTTDTDVITFSYGSTAAIEAEIFISYQMVTENAHKYIQSTENELLRVIIHGFLHCLGFVDNTQQTKEQMRQLENTWIDKYHVKHHSNE